MGNKAATAGQLEQAREAPGFNAGAMSGNDAHEEGCASVALPPSGVADGDQEAYDVSPEEGSGEEGEAAAAVAVAVAPSEEVVEGVVNYTRNNSQSSASNNRPPGSPPLAVAAVTVSEPVLDLDATSANSTAERRAAETVPPPPRVQFFASASSSVSPPRAPGGSDLQLPPPLQDLPVPGSEEVRLGARGSPSSADGRDREKGAQ